jgi:hypothetical protein
MKRAAAALVMLGLGTAMAIPANAATNQFGSAQIKYTVAATAALSIAVNYSPATGSIQAAVAGTIFPAGTGSCSAGIAEGANATLTFGSITPPTGATAEECYYSNAVSVGVSTNDSLGYTVQEGVDSVPAGTLICMFPTNAVPAALPPASGSTGAKVTASTPSTTTCPTVNAVAGVALTATTGQVAPTVFGAAGAPAGVTTNVSATPGSFTGGGVLAYTVAAGAPAAGYKYFGQDIAMNIDGSAASGAGLTRTVFYELIPG